VFPTTRLHAELAADYALGLAEMPRGFLRVSPDAEVEEAT
jgi:hypothetical protein